MILMLVFNLVTSSFCFDEFPLLVFLSVIRQLAVYNMIKLVLNTKM